MTLKTIALLCQITWGGYVVNIEQKQLECQVFYIKCMGEKTDFTTSGSDALKKCVLLRDIARRKQK